MERLEAEGIYDLGRDWCVEVILELASSVERLVAQSGLLEERVRRLEEQTRQSSRTGSKPPSQDPPKTRQQRRAEARAKAKELLARDAEKRAAGGQSGHPGAGRPLADEGQVDEFVDHYPDSCLGCGHEFGEEEKLPSRRPGRRRVAELSPITVIVTEHRSHRLRCPCCKRRTAAGFPAEVAGSAFGTRLQAAVITLTARHRVSRRGLSELARDLFGNRDEHAVAAVDRVGTVVAQTTATTQDAAFERLLTWAEKVTPGARAWAIEGSGSYGAGLTRFLTLRGERVLEVHRLTRDRRSHAKTDPIDAVRAARTALSRDLQATPRNGEGREALRILIATRRSAVDSRRVALQQLRAFIVTAPEPLRQELSKLTQARLLARCARLRLHTHTNRAARALTLGLRTCAQRALQARDETDMLEKEIIALVDELAPGLRDEPGVGPISAAQLLITWSHPGRIRSEAAFARIAGVAPIPASSGKTIRHRLDRGGDRQLNRALHTIVLSRRQRQHPATIAYIERRIAEGKTSREAARCLKRYTARHHYRRLNAIANNP